MYKDKKILAIITARGGSKGLPKKNIKELCGKPLIVWTIQSAQRCTYIDELFVSTDCNEIAAVCENYGAPVPFLRPAHLAEDHSSSVDVVEHVVASLEEQGKYFDYIVLLEPTSPLRKKDDLNTIVEQVVTNAHFDGLITLGEVHTEHPMIVKKITDDGKIASYIEDVKKISQRQQADKAYFPYGVAYVIKVDVFKDKKAFYTDNMDYYIIERWQNYEVDDVYDFLCIEAILKNELEQI